MESTRDYSIHVATVALHLPAEDGQLNLLVPQFPVS